MVSDGLAALAERRTFFVKEHVGLFKLTDTFDILDPESQALLAVARETPPAWLKFARLLVNKTLLPTTVTVSSGGEHGPELFRIRKTGFIRKHLTVEDAGGKVLGSFQSKIFSIHSYFTVHDAAERQIAEVKGDWKGWNFRFLSGDGTELGLVTKKWAGIGKELFTSADNYVVSISPAFQGEPAAVILLLAAAISIDVVFKENNR